MQAIGNGSLRARIPAPFAAVMRALQLQGADTTKLRSLSNGEWRDLLPVMDRARLTLPIAQQAKSCLPCWVRERLENNLADAARHWERVRAAYSEAATTLDANNVEYLVLKGFTQAPDFVLRPELRWQGDIDLYVPREHIPAAVRALQEIGYASCHAEEIYRYADHLPTLVRFGAWKWSGNVHILRVVFSAESPVHHVRELATFLDKRAFDDDFWKEWIAMHSPRLRSMQAIAFSLAVAWFSCNQNRAVRAEIDLLSPPLRSWIDTCGCAPVETLFRRTRDGRLLQFLLAETSGARRKIINMALAPRLVPGPAMAASLETHPTIAPAKPNLIHDYLAYPAYLLSRIWMNGSAILRFLAHGYLLQLAHVRLRTVRSGEIGDSSMD
jgi:hypothetical protein